MTTDGEHRTCDCGKVCLSNAEAHTAAHRMNQRQQNDHAPVHAYRCGTCWHVGHVPLRARKNDRRKKRGLRGYTPKPVTPTDQLPEALRPHPPE